MSELARLDALPVPAVDDCSASGRAIRGSSTQLWRPRYRIRRGRATSIPVPTAAGGLRWTLQDLGRAERWSAACAAKQLDRLEHPLPKRRSNRLRGIHVLRQGQQHVLFDSDLASRPWSHGLDRANHIRHVL